MDMDVYLHMDAYLRSAGAGYLNYNAPESQPESFPTSTMHLFPSESMVLEDIDLDLDTMGASFPSESTILEDIDVDIADASFPSASTILENIDIVDASFFSGNMENTDADVVDASLFSRLGDHPVSSMSQFPMTYTPEYVPGPSISNFARSSHSVWCELPSLPTIPISKSKCDDLYLYRL